MRIWTIGHSTRKIDIVLSLLQKNEIKLVADVRMYPGSKRYPQFGCEALAKSLGEAGIRYEHFPELGGRRKAKPDSKNTAWRNEMFRGYADYMETEDFRDRPSTGENIVRTLWPKIDNRVGQRLVRLRLWETMNNRFTLRRT